MKPDTHHCFSTSTLCERPIESCLVSHYLVIYKQGRDRLNPTYSEGDRTRSCSTKASPPVNGKAASER
ncbi:hypothetical protein [Microcoleus sp. LAD1_D3]|uniref:hypothetical protein n=1 Tax=Microcoleus sp. LAD1_D3 TaxID=2819365 RepID=UPI002FCE8BDC